ncbi:hypothetical protein SNOG_13381 [Parastagonospora nodorum SN15]|uniref:Uncharacterized protein n=1 Tax=Phaeosphaeria nodorum (strain SN15 / ATCC MYA-4574 / FGSC 10173) TaxID=321614 RepID=Q0U4D3_PHANO|nr:hypothetical protein SNOG_13381 [Parastagonospora nodorum SN15]EAT79265.1 hypothetical protein SNOG_13381 [Parastagonospora nodorum SN15]
MQQLPSLLFSLPEFPPTNQRRSQRRQHRHESQHSHDNVHPSCRDGDGYAYASHFYGHVKRYDYFYTGSGHVYSHASTPLLQPVTPAPVTSTVTSSFTSTPPAVTSTVTPAPVTSTVTPVPVTSTVTPAPVTSTITPAPVTSTVTPAPVTSTVTPAPVTSTVTSGTTTTQFVTTASANTITQDNTVFNTDNNVENNDNIVRYSHVHIHSYGRHRDVYVNSYPYAQPPCQRASESRRPMWFHPISFSPPLTGNSLETTNGTTICHFSGPCGKGVEMSLPNSKSAATFHREELPGESSTLLLCILRYILAAVSPVRFCILGHRLPAGDFAYSPGFPLLLRFWFSQSSSWID